MKAKFLTGLVATTAAIASALIGGTAQAFSLTSQTNLKTLDPTFYDTLVSDYLIQGLDPVLGNEGIAVVNPEQYALNGMLKTVGSSVDVFFIDTVSYTALAVQEDRITFKVNGGSPYDAFNLDSTNQTQDFDPGAFDDTADEVKDGEGFSIKGLAAGDILDFALNTVETGFGSSYFGTDFSDDAPFQHIIAYEIEHNNENWVYLGWEDLSSDNLDVDWDFNDAAIVIRGVTVMPPIIVPEPGVTLALLGIAAGSLGLRRRKDAE
ncbi:MAG: PEP-CTERM sorting domain-containing protein [Cyanobacteria bacterium SBLK]|nr:PEP-CTERM sorting domain-containing protein [Cyanobacteria bacterium SBLK]